MRRRRYKRGSRKDYSNNHRHFWKKDKLAANIIMRRDYSIHPPMPIIRGREGIIGFHRKPIGVKLDENIAVEMLDVYEFGFIEKSVRVDLMKGVTPVIMVKCIEGVYYLNICAMRQKGRGNGKTFEIILGWELAITELDSWFTIFLGLNITEIYVGYNCDNIVDECRTANFVNANFHPLDTLDVEYGVLQSITSEPYRYTEATYTEATYKEVLNGDMGSDVGYEDLTFNMDFHKKYTLTYITGKRTGIVYKIHHYPMKLKTTDLTDLIVINYMFVLDWLDIDKLPIRMRGGREGIMRFVRNIFIDKIGERALYGNVKEMWELLVDKT